MSQHAIQSSSVGTQTAKITGAKPQRMAALDFTKGALVLCMVLYHSLNYLRWDHGREYLVYLRFLPPSFILITGFILTRIYLTKYKLGEPGLYGRLVVRGLKLIALFLLLNIAANSIVRQNFNGQPMGISLFLANLPMTLLTGAGRRATFEVLLPIGYLLIFAGPLLLLNRSWRWGLHVLFVLLLTADYLAVLNGMNLPNLSLFAVGVLGMVFGLYGEKATDFVVRYRWFVTVGYVVYVASLSIYGESFFSQFCGVCLTLALFYVVGDATHQWRGFGPLMLLLGRYSLLAYVAQIAILQVMLRVVRRINIPHSRFAFGLVSALVLTVGVVLVTDWLRKRSSLVDRGYKLVFA